MSETITDENRSKAKEMVQGILKHGLLSQEYEQDYINSFDGDEVVNLFIDVSDTMIKNAKTKERELRLITLTFSFGSEYGDTDVINHAIERMVEWRDEYGETPALLAQVEQAQEAQKNPME